MIRTSNPEWCTGSLSVVVRCTGETVRRLKTRLKDHQKVYRVGTEAMSAVAEHICMHKHQHPIKWEETNMLD